MTITRALGFTERIDAYAATASKMKDVGGALKKKGAFSGAGKKLQ